MLTGPSIHSNLKRMYCSDIESDSDEMMEMRKEEDEKRKRKIKLLPKKLFKADEDIASSRG